MVSVYKIDITLVSGALEEYKTEITYTTLLKDGRNLTMFIIGYSDSSKTIYQYVAGCVVGNTSAKLFNKVRTIVFTAIKPKGKVQMIDAM